MYSSNMLRIWSKRWCVMGTPVAGSCSWHRLWGTSSRGFMFRRLELRGFPGGRGSSRTSALSRAGQAVSPSQESCGARPHALVPHSTAL